MTASKPKKPAHPMAHWRSLQVAKRAALAKPQAHTLTVIAPPRWFHDVARKVAVGPQSGDQSLVMLSVALNAAAQRNGVVLEPVPHTLRPVRVKKTK